MVGIKSGMTPLEKRTLEQYKLLSDQLKTLNNDLGNMNNQLDLQPAIKDATKLPLQTGEERKMTEQDLISQLRSLESTLSMVGTLFKSSVYKILMIGQDSQKEVINRDKQDNDDDDVNVNDESTEEAESLHEQI